MAFYYFSFKGLKKGNRENFLNFMGALGLESFEFSSCRFLKIRVSQSNDVGAWRSLVACLVWVQEAGGSNPLAPTIK